jgi:NADP-dependent 3-hydroxy acid dehydrogenase YdfG
VILDSTSGRIAVITGATRGIGRAIAFNSVAPALPLSSAAESPMR